MTTRAMPGGAQAALTTSEAYVDLSALDGRTVEIWCDDGDFWFCAAADGTASGSLVTAGVQAASTTALVAARTRAGWKEPLFISNTHSVLVAKMVTGTGTLKVKVLSDVGAIIDAEAVPSSGATTTVSGAVTATTTPAAAVPTTNATYIASGDMSGDVAGAAVTIGPEGELEVTASWTNTGAPIGQFLLQSLSLVDGSTWRDIPGSSTGFGRHPNNDTAAAGACRFYGLRIFGTVRVLYRRTSGGTANTSLTAGTRTI